MNQAFNLRMASETIAKDAQKLGVSISELRSICIKVVAKLIEQPTMHLQLTYQVTLPSQILVDQLNWPMWQQAKVKFTDYLWEETCLECFIAGSEVKDKSITTARKTAPYIEMNASPDGRYALYQFKSYRTPARLPPIPLYDTDGTTRVSINWDNSENLVTLSSKSPLLEKSQPPDTISAAQTAFYYERSFKIPITLLANQQYAIADIMIKQIHPCVILWFGETALYFATNHASPPDFHNRDYWSKFKP